MSALPPPVPTADAASPIRMFAVGAVIGVVAVGMIATLLWLFARPPTDGVAADVETACGLVEAYDADRVAELTTVDDPGEEVSDELWAMTNRIRVATALADAAAETDEEYADLFEALLEATEAAVSSFDWSGDEVVAALEKAEQECGAL